MTQYYNIHALLHVIFHSWSLNSCPISKVNLIYRSAAICYCCLVLQSLNIPSISVLPPREQSVEIINLFINHERVSRKERERKKALTIFVMIKRP